MPVSPVHEWSAIISFVIFYTVSDGNSRQLCILNLILIDKIDFARNLKKLHTKCQVFLMTALGMLRGRNVIRASTWENVPSDKCSQRRFRLACAFAQSDQNLHWAHFGETRMQGFFMRKAKTLIRLCEVVG